MYESGGPKERGRYDAGKRHGLWETLDEAGNRLVERDYEAGAIRAVRQWDADGSPITDAALEARATCGGKYRGLMYRFHVPDDRKRYGEFKDYGHYRQTDYQDVKAVPAGYWVYVHPYWYVWRETSR